MKGITRRTLLASAVGVGVAGGAAHVLASEETAKEVITSRRPRDEIPGVPMTALPDLEGELTVYSGRSKGLVEPLLSFIDDSYPELDLTVRFADPIALTNQLLEEDPDATDADVFYSVHGPGTIGTVADGGLTQPLSNETMAMAENRYQGEGWTGISGRVRSVTYNTDALSGSDVPRSIYAFPDADHFAGEIGWDPVIPSFQAFITAMRVIDGESTTRDWLEGMLALDPNHYSGGFKTCQSVADGKVSVGLSNHYHPHRVRLTEPDAPIATVFTQEDPGSVFNVAGAAMLETASDPEIADAFVRHLLSAEAQEYFTMAQTHEYPVVETIEPNEVLLPRDELAPPPVSFADLRDLDGTIDLLKEYDIL